MRSDEGDLPPPKPVADYRRPPEDPLDFPGDARNLELSKQVVAGLRFYTNVDVEVITISSDRLHRIAADHLRRAKESRTPLSYEAAIAALATLITADFHDAYGLPAVAWKTTFILLVAYGVLRTILGALKRSAAGDATPESFVREVRGRGEPTTRERPEA